jgi:hypothetical protein
MYLVKYYYFYALKKLKFYIYINPINPQCHENYKITHSAIY